MEVTMSNACGRCGKTESRPVEIEEVIDARERQERQKGLMAALHTYINDDSDNLKDFPEMVVLIKTSSGVQLKSLDNLCSSNGNGKKKGCTHRVATLMNDVFMDGPKKPTKKKGPKKESSEE